MGAAALALIAAVLSIPAQPAAEQSGDETVDDALQTMRTGFVEEYGDCLELVAVTEANLTPDPWPETSFRLFRARSLCDQDRIVSYTYVRTRPDGLRDTVQLGVWIVGVPEAQTRVVTAASGFELFTVVPSETQVEIPVPVSDPYGELSDFEWLPAEIQSELPHDLPPSCENEVSLIAEQGADYLPQLEALSVHCQEILLANLDSRTQIWWLLQAAAPGLHTPAFGPAIRVLEAEEQLVVMPRLLVGRATGPDGSSSPFVQPGVFQGAVVQLRPGDQLLAR